VFILSVHPSTGNDRVFLKNGILGQDAICCVSWVGSWNNGLDGGIDSPQE